MLTRRNFIEQIAATGGVSLAYDSLHGLGLMAASESVPFNLRGTVSGVRVAVIGGGLAGLTVAYELEKLGYTTHVLEARPRPGGRVVTIRRGTVSEEDGSTQTCSYDEGQYFNPGPMRIAYHHDTTLAYCRELGVPLEVFAVNGDNAFFYPTKGTGLTNRRVRMREVRADIDGYVSELLSKATAQNVLDDVLTKDDRQRLLDYLRAKGRLSAQGKYAGNIQMRGPDEPAAADGVEKATPHALSDLLGSRMLNQVDLTYEYQPTMFQVVGGMDHLPRTLAARVKGSITYNAAAREIRQHEQGVTVTYADKGGALRKLEADYLVCALPLPLLAEVDTDFTPEFKALVSSVPYAAAGKIQAPVLGRRPSDLRGRHEDRHGHHADRLSLHRLSRQEGHARGLLPAGAERPAGRRHHASRAAGAGPRAGHEDPSAVCDRVRARLLGGLAQGEVEQGVVVGHARGDQGQAAGAAGPGLPGRRPPRSECLDAGRLRVGAPRGHRHSRPGRGQHAPAGALRRLDAPAGRRSVRRYAAVSTNIRTTAPTMKMRPAGIQSSVRSSIT